MMKSTHITVSEQRAAPSSGQISSKYQIAPKRRILRPQNAEC